MVCEYKNSLGVPGEGVHRHVMGFAVADIVMTLIGAWLISYLTNWSFLYVAVLLFILGIVLHRIFCVRTTIDKILFP